MSRDVYLSRIFIFPLFHNLRSPTLIIETQYCLHDMTIRFSTISKFIVIIAFIVFPPSAFAQEGAVLRLPAVHGANSKYTFGLIKMALAYGDSKYSYTFDIRGVPPSRQVIAINEGRQDMMWAATTPEFEKDLMPIRVPLFRGLMGYRVLMIREGDQARFNHIKKLADLNTVSIAQGLGWADTEILIANAIDVLVVNKYQGLFHMLDGGRYDGFPRGIHEPWAEMDARPDLSLTVEENIMLIYRMPYYMFVAKENHSLATELEDGLMQAIADGSFVKYFLQNPVVKSALEKSDLKNRRVVFYLTNPWLSEETPGEDSGFWLDPENF